MRTSIYMHFLCDSFRNTHPLTITSVTPAQSLCRPSGNGTVCAFSWLPMESQAAEQKTVTLITAAREPLPRNAPRLLLVIHFKLQVSVSWKLLFKDLASFCQTCLMDAYQQQSSVMWPPETHHLVFQQHDPGSLHSPPGVTGAGTSYQCIVCVLPLCDHFFSPI